MLGLCYVVVELFEYLKNSLWKWKQLRTSITTRTNTT